MGNEMGNNNTSGLKEEDNTNAIDSKNVFQEAADADDVKGEDETVPTNEAKDFHEKVTGLASNDSTGAKDTHTAKETSGGREQEENEVLFPTESPKAVVKAIEASNEENHEVQPSSLQKGSDAHEKTIESNFQENLLVRSDHQLQKQDSINEEQEENEVHSPAESLKAVVKSVAASDEDNEITTAFSPKDLEVHEKPIDSNLKENLLGTNDHQLEKQASISEDEDEDSTLNTISTPHDPEPQQSLHFKSNQLALDKVNADQSEEEGCILLHKSEDILGSSFICANKNSHPLGPNLSNNLGDNPDVEKMGDSLVKEAPYQEDKMSFKEKIEIIKGDEIGIGLSNPPTITSDTPSIVLNKYNGELSTVANSIRNDSLNLQLEAVLLDRPLNSHQEVSEPQDKCMVLTEETKIVGSGSDIEERPHQYNPTLFCEEPMEEQNTDEANESQREFRKLGSENEDKLVCNQNKNSDGSCQDSEGELSVVAEHGLVTVPVRLIVTGHRCEEEQQKEKKILEEIEDKAEASYATGNDTEGSETPRQRRSQLLPIEQAEDLLSQSPASIVQSEVHNQDTTIAAETIVQSSSIEPIPELKQEICDEFSVVKASTFNSTSLNIENLISIVELTVTETKTSASHSSVEGIKGEASAFINGSTEAQESMGRLSSESSSDSMNTHVHMRKSPSFDLDLRIEARGEESDQMPLLFQDKATMESSSGQTDFSLGKPVAHVGYKHNQHMLQYQALPVEEKVITLERSDSEKSKTPFLGFLKEEEEAQFVVTPQKQENHAVSKKATRELCNLSTEEAAPTAPKGKEKRKHRSSFFGNCMCCATVIN
ncbi:hypothetical protein SO802_027719 [Lithocarpus litseifolius]|uniref:Uncharacterized protein n=1 Tax=Lithocarpus litseifolius TaxID=425828 RepID=A0AAW2C6Z4_9ROSI